jgi:hypothetical protein
LSEALAAERDAAAAAEEELEALRVGDVGSLREQLTLLRELYEDERAYALKVGVSERGIWG